MLMNLRNSSKVLVQQVRLLVLVQVLVQASLEIKDGGRLGEPNTAICRQGDRISVRRSVRRTAGCIDLLVKVRQEVRDKRRRDVAQDTAANIHVVEAPGHLVGDDATDATSSGAFSESLHVLAKLGGHAPEGFAMQLGDHPMDSQSDHAKAEESGASGASGAVQPLP